MMKNIQGESKVQKKAIVSAKQIHEKRSRSADIEEMSRKNMSVDVVLEINY